MVFSALALIISIVSAVTNSAKLKEIRKQTDILAAEKYTDKPINAYTIKLEGISQALQRIAVVFEQKILKIVIVVLGKMPNPL